MALTSQHNKGYLQLTEGSFQLSFGQDKGVLGLYQDVTGPVYLRLTDVRTSEDRTILSYERDGWKMVDRIAPIKKGFYQIHRTWTNVGSDDQDVVLNFEVTANYDPSFYFIPCVNYNGNPWGQGLEPKGLTVDGEPWIFSGNRVSLPAASFSEDANHAVGLFSSLADDASISSCSLRKGETGMTHCVLWPEREEPKTYFGRDQYCAPVQDTVTLKAGESFTGTVYVYVGDVETPNYGWTKAYDYAWELCKRDSKMPRTPENVWELAIDYVKNLVEINDEENALLSIGMIPNAEGVYEFRDHNKFEVGWCGQHASLSTALIKDYLANGNKDSLDLGVKILDTWARLMDTESGLYQVDYKYSLQDKKEKADTCNLSWGAWYMMEAYELLKEAGIKRDNYLEVALRTCDFLMNNYDEKDFFGKAWNIETGECIDRGGSIGVFVMIPLLKAYHITGKEVYLEMTKKAFAEYAKRDLYEMQCTAGALDTCCVDKETCWPFLKVGLDLYEITKDPEHLKAAELAAYYILSWMMHFEPLKEAGNDFEKYGYVAFGGTSVSAQHHHLDPWGGLIAADWFRLGEITGDTRWTERARATWLNAICCISDGTTVINGLERPRGGQNEAYFHCTWAFEGHNEKSLTLNNWLVAWPTAFRLVTLMSTEDWGKFR